VCVVQADRGASLSKSHPAGSEGPKAGRLVITALLVIALDVATKMLVVARLQDRPPVRLLGGAVYLIHTRNTGAAFSLGRGNTLLLSLFAIGVVIYISRTARTLRSAAWAVSLGLILGGALGNLIDRIFRSPGVLRGAVVDFISVFSDSGRVFPVFNVADSCLVIGACLLVLLVLRGVRPDGGSTPTDVTASPEVPDSPSDQP
jgi:signal peptidase II